MKKKNLSFNWSESMYKPPFDITSEMLHLISEISVDSEGACPQLIVIRTNFAVSPSI